MDETPVASNVLAVSPRVLAMFSLNIPETWEKLTPAFSMIDPFCITQVNPEPISFSQASEVNFPVPSATSRVQQMVVCMLLKIAAVFDMVTVVVFWLKLSFTSCHSVVICFASLGYSEGAIE